MKMAALYLQNAFQTTKQSLQIIPQLVRNGRLLSAPIADWCENGTVVPGGEDENGCPLPAECVPNNETDGTTATCDNGCIYGEDCVAVGTRETISGDESYCGSDNSWLSQKRSRERCQNDWECGSNSCLRGRCSRKRGWRGLVNFLKGIF